MSTPSAQVILSLAEAIANLGNQAKASDSDALRQLVTVDPDGAREAYAAASPDGQLVIAAAGAAAGLPLDLSS